MKQAEKDRRIAAATKKAEAALARYRSHQEKMLEAERQADAAEGELAGWKQMPADDDPQMQIGDTDGFR